MKVAKIKLQNSVDKTAWRLNINNYINIKKHIEFDKFNNEFDRRNTMFEKAPALNANARAVPKPMKSKPMKRKIIEEYDIGSNGDELLAKEIGKPDSNRNENANKAIYKPTIKKSTPNIKKDNKSCPKQASKMASQENSQ